MITSWTERFYKVYGNRIFLIEAILILMLILVFVVYHMLVPVGVVGAWILTAAIAIGIHMLIYTKIKNMKLYPDKLLVLDRFRLHFALTMTFILSLTVALTLLDIKLSLGEQHPIVNEIMKWISLIIPPLVMTALSLRVVSIDAYEKARLSFIAFMRGMRLAHEEHRPKERAKLIRKHIRWFREGLCALNKDLYERASVRFQIVDTDQFHLNVCSAALMGTEKERKLVIEQTHLLLESIRKTDLKCILIALKNLKDMKSRKGYPLTELNKMIVTMSFSHRMKEKLKSPYVTTLLGIIIAITALVLEMMHLFGMTPS